MSARTWTSLFGQRPARGTLDRASLPTPTAYLTKCGLLKRKPRGEWVAITCPVHAGGKEEHPSLLISLVQGRFRCMACNASGGDVLALHRLITGLGFRRAVADLGGRFHD
jgi:hypothetical protein